ncbi:MAG TPA: molybdopterin-binding/glycosyltransferase family 2 protein [Haliangiales bacterium]|nr:molybdopterin-binding/glycosyltransferase family 2 protein [Haliangiales bacterium]
MKFGRVPVAEAVGAILAHTLRAGGAVLKKGRPISAADAERLAAAGHVEVVCARLEPGDVPEDQAAARVAAAVAGAGVAAAAPATGRANVFAGAAGVLRVDAAGVDAVNLIDETLTVATLPAWARVEAGDMVATVKVIPYGVAEEVVARAVAVGPLVSVAAFRRERVGLVLTRLPGTAEMVLDRAAASQRERVVRIGGSVVGEVRTAHDEGAVADALATLVEDCSLILVLGASAIADRADVVPAAIVRAGGTVDQVGMPVDPGNLLCLGRRGAVPIVGVPGCARSLRPSGFDWVLERVCAGLPVSARDLMTMGVGGLLVEAPSRPQPRLGPEAEPHAPTIAAVVLAAGRSSRMGENKLLLPFGGKPIVARVVDEVLASRVRQVIVVVGHQAAEVRAALAGRRVTFAENPDYAGGLSTSLRRGLAAVGEDVDGAVICLGDMPLVKRADIDALVAAFDPEGDHTIYVPTFERKRGNPILWARRHFAEMSALAGDAGAKSLLDQHADAVTLVPVADPGVTVDVDTPEALRALRGD